MSEKKEFFSCKFKVKEATDDGNSGRIAGFASIFNTMDQGQDIVHPGAFAKTIKEKKGVFPFLLDHNPYKPAGYSVSMEEQEKGLYYEAEFRLHDPDVKQRYELAKLSLQLGTPMGNSFGYQAVKRDYEDVQMDDGNGGSVMVTVRNLREIKLFEASLVTFPMHEDAGVTAAKSAEILRLFATVQNGKYTLDDIHTALSRIQKDRGAADNDIDPAFRQSIETLRKVFKG